MLTLPAYAILAHATVMFEAPLIGMVAIGLLVMSCGFQIVDTNKKNWRWPKLVAFAAAIIAIISGVIWTNDIHLIYLPPLVINLMVLIFFARSLLPGREALISRFVRVVMKTESPEEIAYARQVTWLWTLFLATMLLETLLLTVFAPLRTWSLFANLLNYVFGATLFAGEYIYRQWRFPGQASLFHVLRRIRQTNFSALIKQ